MATTNVSSLLVKYGLLCHSFAYNDLPVSVQDKLGDENRVHYQDCYLSLIANAGTTFWAKLKATQSDWNDCSEAISNPVDYFSTLVTKQLLQLKGLASDAELLYPGTAPAPLILLGELANWSTPSPLGLGLHPRYGPWLAYRALVRTTSPLTTHCSTIESSNSEFSRDTKDINNVEYAQNPINYQSINAITSPCMRCVSTACVSACPGNAVSFDNGFDISRCATYRLTDNSICKEQCHARYACPVGVEYRYSEEQSAHHMTRALQALVSWANKS